MTPPLSRQVSGDAAAGESRSTSPGMGQMPITTNRALGTYITEPPSTLALLRQYAEEQLVLQEQAEAACSGGGGGGGHARTPSLAEMLSQPLELGPSSADRQRSASPAVDAALAAATLAQAGSGGGDGASSLHLPDTFTPRADLRTFSSLQTDSLAPSSPQATSKVGPSAEQMARTESADRTGLRRRLGVQLLADPLAEERGVHNHRAAGDLFLSPPTRAGAGGFKVRPLPPDAAREVLALDSGKLAARAARNLRRAEPLVRDRRPDKDKDSEHSDAEEEMDLEFGEEEREVPYWRRRRFWVLTFWCAWTLAFLLAGALMGSLLKQQMFRGWFDWWRMLVFVGLWPPIFWTGTLVGRATVWIVESRYLTNEAYLFYIWTVRRPLAWVVRAGLLLGSWAACLYDPAYGDEDLSVAQARFERAYLIIVKLLSCVLLFTIAELLKVLIAKMIASKFNRESHVKKMRAALKKEHYLHALLQPRERPDWRGWRPEGEDDMEGSDDGKGFKGGDEGVDGEDKAQQHRKKGRGMLLGMPSLSRRSAPMPAHQGSRSFRSKLSPARLFTRSARRMSAPTLDMRGLAPIDEAKEEEPPSVAVQIGTPPATPPSARAGRGSSASSPARLPLGGHNAFANGYPSPPKSPAKVAPELGGALLKQGSIAAGAAKPGATAAALLRQGSVAAGLTRQGSLPHTTLRALPLSKQDGRTGSTSTHNVNGDAASNAAPPPRQQSTTLELLGSSSASSALQRGDVALAVKMNRVEKHIRKKALQVTFYDELSMSQRQEKVTTEIEAKRLAFFLFHNIKTDPDRPYLIIEDLEAFMTEKAAQGAFAMLDLNANGRVSLPECAAAVMSVFKEREYLANSLRDTKMIVKKLGFMIGIGIHTVFFFIYLLILGINAWQVFVSMVPLLGAISFAVGSTVKQTVDASVFLFVTHPYDVGDIIVFNDAWHRVEEITLPATVLLRTADSAKIWYPNSLLVNMPIQNMTMSPPLAELTTFVVDADTPATAAEELRTAVLKYTAERPNDFTNKVTTWFDLARDQTRPNKLAIRISVEFAYNLLNPRCIVVRGALFHFMLQFLQSKGIEVANTLQPVLLQQGLQGMPGLPPAGLGPAGLGPVPGAVGGL